MPLYEVVQKADFLCVSAHNKRTLHNNLLRPKHTRFEHWDFGNPCRSEWRRKK